jgi:hypothetical protein
MKTIVRGVIDVHYKEEISPTLDFCHNSDQHTAIITENVRKLLQGASFHEGLQLDAQVNTP